MRALLTATTLSLALLAAPARATDPNTTTTATPSAQAPDTDDEAAQIQALDQALTLAQSGRAAEALPLLDAVIAHYEARFPPGKTRWYVARSLMETIAYMAMATTDAGRKTGQTGAQALMVQWADAWFLKGYAVVELSRLDEARVA